MESFRYVRDGQQRHLYTFLISNLEIEFLKKEDPTNESGLDILLVQEISECRLVGEYGGFGPK